MAIPLIRAGIYQGVILKMNADVMKVIGIIGVILILGLILKDAGNFNTAISAVASGTNTVVGGLAKVG